MKISYDKDAVRTELEEFSAKMHDLSTRIRNANERGGKAGAIEFLTEELGTDPVESGSYVHFGHMRIEFNETGEFVGMSTAGNAAIVADNGDLPVSSIDELFKLPARWKLRVGTMSGNPAPLNVAVLIGEDLQVLQTTTPYEIEFTAYHFTAMFGLTDTDEEIEAEAWSDCLGPFQEAGGGSGGKAHTFVFSGHGLTSGSGSLGI